MKRSLFCDDVKSGLLDYKRRQLVAGLMCLSISVIVASSAQYVQAQGEIPQTMLVVGDSLSAEYGLQRGTGWVTLLEKKLQENGLDHVRIVNASISGDTTAGGNARLEAALTQYQPTLVILELGANDALRGLPLAESNANLQAMINASQAGGAKVLLLGVQVPPNYGKAYMEQFAQMYVDLAERNQIALVPFFLANVADSPDAQQYFQRDRTHPNETAQPIILNNIWPVLEGMIAP